MRTPSLEVHMVGLTAMHAGTNVDPSVVVVVVDLRRRSRLKRSQLLQPNQG
jgi:hypothetical protein